MKLPGAQVAVLEAASADDPRTVAQLANETDLPPETVTGALFALEEERLLGVTETVETEADLTAEGETYAGEGLPEVRLYRATLDLGGDEEPVPMGEAIGASGLEGDLVDIALANYARKGYGAVEGGEITADPEADPDADPEAAAIAAVHGDGTALWAFCHRDDVARAFVAALGKDETVGETYHVPSPESLTWNAYIRTVAEAVDAPDPTLVHVPTALLSAVLSRERDQLTELGWRESWLFDTTKAASALDFEATVPLRDGIERTVDWLDERDRIGDSGEEPLDDRIVEAWRSTGDEFPATFEQLPT